MNTPRRIADLPEQDREYLRAVYERAKRRFEAVVDAHGANPGLAEAIAVERVAILDEELAPVFQSMAQVGTPVSGTNFREDVNVNGTISSTDVALVKAKVGTALP